jgi:hypothetical protein
MENICNCDLARYCFYTMVESVTNLLLDFYVAEKTQVKQFFYMMIKGSGYRSGYGSGSIPPTSVADPDPGSRMKKSRIRDKHPGSAKLPLTSGSGSGTLVSCLGDQT